jgi:hypothetical protein
LFGKVSFEPKEGDKKKPRRNQKKPRGPRH